MMSGQVSSESLGPSTQISFLFLLSSNQELLCERDEGLSL